MWFDIPPQHRGTPEAQRLLKVDAEYAQVVAQEREGIATKLYARDLPAFMALAQRSRKVQKALREAVEAYDRVTGEPAPVELSPEVLQTIEQDFAAADRPEVIAKLGKMLGYLRRQRVQDQRVPKYVLQLAKGDKQQLMQHADIAVRDYRDVICAVENRR